MNEPKTITLNQFNFGGGPPSGETHWVSRDDYLKLKEEFDKINNISAFCSLSTGKSLVPNIIEIEYLKAELEHCKNQLKDNIPFKKHDKLIAENQFLKLENQRLRANVEYLDSKLDEELDKSCDTSKILSALGQKMLDIKKEFDKCKNLDDQTILVKNMVDDIVTPPPMP